MATRDLINATFDVSSLNWKSVVFVFLERVFRKVESCYFWTLKGSLLNQQWVLGYGLFVESVLLGYQVPPCLFTVSLSALKVFSYPSVTYRSVLDVLLVRGISISDELLQLKPTQQQHISQATKNLQYKWKSGWTQVENNGDRRKKYFECSQEWMCWR